MKTRKLFFLLIALAALLLAACSPQAAASEAMMSENSASDQDMAAESMPKDETSDMEVDMAADAEDDATDHKDDTMMDEGETMADDGMMAETDTKTHEDDSMMEDEMGEDAMMADKDDAMMEDAMTYPGWLTSELVEARSGESFKIADYKGKVVLALKRYIEERGFDWQYAIAPSEVSREIGQLYGDQFLNPPSTPMLIIDGNGEVHPLPFGIKDANSLLEALQPYLEAGM